MNHLRRLIRTTLIGGAVFLIPLVLVVAVVGKAFQIMKVVATPVSNLIPIESFAGLAFAQIVTAVIMLLSCLVAGLLARSPRGHKVSEKFDAVLLQIIPGWAWVKSVTSSIQDEDAEEVMKPVLVRLDDQFQLAFEVDRATDGLVAVYLPGSPNPRSGGVSYVTGDRIRPLDAGFKTVLKIYHDFGRGATGLLSGSKG